MAQSIFNVMFLFLSALLVTVSAQAKVEGTMGAVGIAVESLTRSQKFYSDVLGLKPNGMTFQLPQFDEVVLTMPGSRPGSAIVLMQWKQQKQIKNLPVKLVFYVEDVKAVVEKIRTAGGKIDLEPGSFKIANRTIPTAMTRDLDGYMLELNPLSLLGKGASG